MRFPIPLPAFLAAALVLLPLARPVAASAPAAEAFPELTGESLAETPISLPADLKGKKGLVIFAFAKGSQEATRAWADRFEGDLGASHPLYQVANLEGVPFFIKGIARNGIRSKTPEGRRARYLVLTEKRDETRRILGYDEKAENDAYLAIVAPNGSIAWKGHALFSEEEYQRFRKAFLAVAPAPAAAPGPGAGPADRAARAPESPSPLSP